MRKICAMASPLHNPHTGKVYANARCPSTFYKVLRVIRHCRVTNSFGLVVRPALFPKRTCVLFARLAGADHNDFGGVHFNFNYAMISPHSELCGVLSFQSHQLRFRSPASQPQRINWRFGCSLLHRFRNCFQMMDAFRHGVLLPCLDRYCHTGFLFAVRGDFMER